MLFNAIVLAASVGIVSGANFQVAVGSGGLKYNPATIMAAVGDTVEFDFSTVSHNVVQSSFASPCSPSTGGFSVSPQSSSSAKFTITVNTTNPTYFYCSVANHCTSGMVGIINPPSSGGDLTSFMNAAKSATISQPSGNVPVGGILSTGASSSGSSSAASSSGTSSATGSAASGSSSSSSKSSSGAAATALPQLLAIMAGAVAVL